MSKAAQIKLDDMNDLQRTIMQFVDNWVRTKNTPIPKKEILFEMKTKGVKGFTIEGAINSLLHKGYIRRAFTLSNKTRYVQLRGI